MTNETINQARNYIKHFSGLCSVDAYIFDVLNKRIDDCYCNCCPKKCEYMNTHRYGMYEAQRWNGKYIYYCPMGFIFIAVSIYNDNGGVDTGIIAGPIIMGEMRDFLDELPEDIKYGDDIISLSTQKVNSCAEILHIMFQNMSAVVEFKKGNQEKFLNDLYKISSEVKYQKNYEYPIDIEKKLQQAIIDKDEYTSKDLLNMLLGHIFFSSNGDFLLIKHRAIELIVLLSRAAIEGGADIGQILMLNTDYFSAVEKIRNMYELNVWLANIINRFVSYVFDFVDVKHLDTMHKVVRYIKENYREKLTLESISNNVHFSKSYLSKIFKDEMNCSITSYINNVRIEKSKKLLLGDIGIVDIANLVGFEDQSYFTKVFKKTEGVSPGKYRENRGLR